MDLHPDFRDLLAEFDRADVRFALLGGYAVAYYGRPRATKDLDLLVSGEGDNPLRVAQALDAFGAPPDVVLAARSHPTPRSSISELRPSASTSYGASTASTPKRRCHERSRSTSEGSGKAAQLASTNASCRIESVPSGSILDVTFPVSLAA